MVSRKYVGDYRLENVGTKNGKTVTKAVYRGDLFDFEKSENDVVKLKKTVLRTTVIEWLVFVLALLINSSKGRVMYVSLPLIAVAFPLLGQSRIIGLFFKKREGYKREEKDMISERLVSYTFMVLFFSLCSAIGHVINWIMYGESNEDAILLSLTVALVASSYSLFRKRGDLGMKKTGTAKLPEAEEE